MLKFQRRKILGFTFTELMVALALNVFILAGLVTLFVRNIDHYRETININRLNNQLLAVMLLMTNEIRRAGYWSNAYTDIGLGQNNNPFMATGLDVTVNASGNCILFSYDHDKNGALPSVSNSYDDERYGFRLSNQAVQGRPPGASFDCTAASTAWENLTDTNVIQITALTFTLTTKSVNVGAGSTILQRGVDISMTGRLASDNSVTRTLTQHVRIRNDKFSP